MSRIFSQLRVNRFFHCSFSFPAKPRQTVRCHCPLRAHFRLSTALPRVPARRDGINRHGRPCAVGATGPWSGGQCSSLSGRFGIARASTFKLEGWRTNRCIERAKQSRIGGRTCRVWSERRKNTTREIGGRSRCPGQIAGRGEQLLSYTSQASFGKYGDRTGINHESSSSRQLSGRARSVRLRCSSGTVDEK